MNTDPSLLPAALERAALTIRQCDGLPPLMTVQATLHRRTGEPIIIVDPMVPLGAYQWGNHLRLSPLPDVQTGEVEFRGRVNGVLWSVLYQPDSPIDLIPTDLARGAVYRTQALPVVAETRG